MKIRQTDKSSPSRRLHVVLKKEKQVSIPLPAKVNKNEGSSKQLLLKAPTYRFPEEESRRIDEFLKDPVAIDFFLANELRSLPVTQN